MRKRSFLKKVDLILKLMITRDALKKHCKPIVWRKNVERELNKSEKRFQKINLENLISGGNNFLITFLKISIQKLLAVFMC